MAAAFTAKFITHASSPCFGTSVDDEPFAWLTYSDVHCRALAIGAGLHYLAGDRAMVAMCAPNSLDLLHVDLAALWAGFTSAPFDAGCRDRDIIAHIINTTQATMVVCSYDALATIYAVSPSCASLKHIVVIDSRDGRPLPALDSDSARAVSSVLFTRTKHNVVKISLLSAVEAAGAEILDAGPIAPLLTHLYGTAPDRSAALMKRVRARSDDEVFSIIFTSGSTGLPKGVIWSEGRWLRDMVSYPDTVSASHMPLSHITDRHGVYTTLFSGGRCGVYEATAHKGPAGLFDGWLTRLSPSILKGSPRHWTTLLDMFNDSGSTLEEWRETRVLGTRVSVLVSGGAHLASTTKLFLQTAFPDAIIIDGYGATESGNITSNGILTEGTQIKLLDLPALQYFSADKPLPRGELLVKTKAPFEGYFADSKKTSETLDADGWYHTGDIVSFDAATKRVDILGRSKFVIKLANAEYISPERVERDINAGCSLVHRVMVYGDSEAHFIVAIVSLDKDGVCEWWDSTTAKDSDEVALSMRVEELSKLPGLHAAMAADFARIGAEMHSANWEVLRRFTIAPAVFSERDGTVGTSGKIKRAKLKQMYGIELARMLGHDLHCTSSGSASSVAPAAPSTASQLMGSMSDHELARRAMGADRRSLLLILNEIVTSVLSEPRVDVTIDTRIAALGLDSSDIAKMQRRFRSVFGGVHLPIPVFGGESTLTTLVDEILARRQQLTQHRSAEQLTTIVAAIACDLVGLPSSSPPTADEGDVAIASLDSLGKTRLRSRLKQMHGVDLMFAVLIDVRSIVAAAMLDARDTNALRHESKGEPELHHGTDLLPPLPAEVRADAHLHQGIRFSPSCTDQWWRWGRGAGGETVATATAHSEVIFVTGATGFLGPHVIKALCSHDSVTHVACMVRAKDDAEATARLKKVMTRVGLADAVASGPIGATTSTTIFAVHGSLGAPGLGITAHLRAWIVRNVSAIIHAGARVSLAAPYAKMRAANVTGTADVLALAFACERNNHRRRGAAVVFVSSYDVFGHVGALQHTYHPRFIVPDDEIERAARGYAHTKWVGERLCAEAAERGLSVSIVRLDLVSGGLMGTPPSGSDTSSAADAGVCSSGSWSERILRGILHHRAVPSPSSTFSNAVGVDVAARAIVAVVSGDASLDAPPYGRAYHVGNPNPQPRLETLASAVETFLGGETIRRIPYKEWRREIEADETSPLFALWTGFGDTGAVPAFGTKSVQVSAMLVPRGSTAAVEVGALGAVPIECAPFDEDAAVAMLRWMEARGEL
jgi:thioester reductase-like protein